MESAQTGKRCAFTIIELLVVTSVIAILMAILLPAIQHARELARRMQCRNHLRQIGLALHNYDSTHAVFPPDALAGDGTGGCEETELSVEDNPSHCTEYQSWTTLVLPYLDQPTITQNYDYGSPWSSLRNRPFVKTQLSVFQCPSTPAPQETDTHHVVGAAAGDYGAINQVTKRVYTEVFGVADPGLSARTGVLAQFEANPPARITDGLSNTMMIAESCGRPDVYVGSDPMSKTQFAAYRGDEVVSVAGDLVAEDGIGWADPDSRFNVAGVQEDGITTLGSGFINKINLSEAYSFHSGGVLVLLSDGSVRFLSENIDSWTYVTLCTRAGGEVVGEF